MQGWLGEGKDKGQGEGGPGCLGVSPSAVYLPTEPAVTAPLVHTTKRRMSQI